MAEQLRVDISLVKHQRCVIEFCVRLGNSGSETLHLIHQVYGDDAMRWPAVFKWWKRFRNRETNVTYEPRRSKPPVPLSSWSLRQTVCSTFSRSGWSFVINASLTKGGTSKKRPSPHLHMFRLGVKMWVHQLFKRPSYLETCMISNTCHRTHYMWSRLIDKLPRRTSLLTLNIKQLKTLHLSR
jgi:hypothetical protein